MFLDIHKQLSNGNLVDFLKESKCNPRNCKQYSWDYSTLFEGTYLDDVSGAFGSFQTQDYLLNFYMKTPEVRFLQIS